MNLLSKNSGSPITPFLVATLLLLASGPSTADDGLPIVPDGFVVDVVATEPLVSNPCVMAFDRLGRLCVAQGQQWRAPTPETPGDRVDILIDSDGDGVADDRRTFADGFNCIQGIAWHGEDLWVANAPDLTVVRDTDGDDRADVYLRVYTGLGNLEHSLHGLNFGPDGRLYMSKGNSKGVNRLNQLAPRPFRELWGLQSPDGAPDYTPVEEFTRETYRRRYHTPSDDWGQQGGILRCDPIDPEVRYGRQLEVVSRGYRNPWDIAYDDTFTWLGTDNDQTQGDRIVAPFFGSQFGWGHAWSFHWTGDDHLPTVPNSAPLFEGSGTGVIHYHATHFPPEYRGVFFVNDWMRREIYAFRPHWDGALMKTADGFPPTFAKADGGRSLPQSSGRVFEPTDIEVGPDGALYVLSWGHGYGATISDGQQIDAGRVYRIRHAASPLTTFATAHRRQPYAEWSLEQLYADLPCAVPAWRTAAQRELLRRPANAIPYLQAELASDELSTASETWTMWTLGLLGTSIHDASTQNRLIQSLRIAAFQKQKQIIQTLPDYVRQSLSSADPRIRHEAVLAIHQAGQPWIDALLNLAAVERDRIVFYSAWTALAALADQPQRKLWLKDSRPPVRLAALLGLLEDNDVDIEDVLRLRTDPDPAVARVANSWLEKTGAAQPVVKFDPPTGEYTEPQMIKLSTSVAGAFLTYTLDGSQPTYTSPRVSGPIAVSQNTVLRVAANVGNTGGSLYASADYTIRYVAAYEHRAFVDNIHTPSGRHYQPDWTGLQRGKRHYTDRDYRITEIPDELTGVPFLRPANNDDRSTGDHWLSFDLTEPCDIIVGVDARNNAPLSWMRIGQPDGFMTTGLQLATTDSVFDLYRKHFPAGGVTLGGNTNDPVTDSGRGNYIVIFYRRLLPPPSSDRPEVQIADVTAALPNADPQRGRELFLHPKGAGCLKCHRMENRGTVLAPDLSDIGTRAKSPQVLMESILDPSRVITEGFAQQNVVTTAGKVYSGSVLEETGRMIRLADSEGRVTTIAKGEIEERIGTKISPMPSGFGRLLTAQQIADIVAWLQTQTVVGDREGFSFRDRPDHLDIFFGKQRIATYLKRHPKLTRRALVNVMTPAGLPVTRNFPPRAPEDIDPGYTAENGIIHPHMHPGIWLGFGDVNGNDYWRLQAEVQFDGFHEAPSGTRQVGTFTARNTFLSEDGQQNVCTEVTRYRFQKVPQGLLLHIDAEYQSDDHDFYFGDQEESGLAVRVASPLRVQGGNGTILNDRGERNGAQIWGREARWFDAFGTIDNRQVGVMVAASPGNPRPSWLHARDYGVIVTNPFPKQPRERREPYVKTWVKRGQPYRLSYAILIHDLPKDQPLDHQAASQMLPSK